MANVAINQLLDSAVKTAVFRLADSANHDKHTLVTLDREKTRPKYPPSSPIDRSRVDYLYYDGDIPSYDYNYYNDFNIKNEVKEKESNELPFWSVDSLYTPENSWVKHAPPKYPKWRPPKPRDTKPSSQSLITTLFNDFQTSIQRRMDEGLELLGLGGAASRVGEVLAGSASYFPGLLAMPLLGAASYYLLVVNAPTPVVHERNGPGLWEMLQTVGEEVLRVMSEEEESGDARAMTESGAQGFSELAVRVTRRLIARLQAGSQVAFE